MLDGMMRRLIDPLLARLARRCLAMGLGADQLTVFGLVTALGSAAAVTLGSFDAALLLLAASRLADGLDGPVARASTPSDRGGFLDIVCDFVFYGALPLGFALHDPGANAVAASVLLFAFYINGASLLAFAAVAAKRGMKTAIRGEKAIYFTVGLAEGTETIAAFVLMMVFPASFAPIALAFAALCGVTTVGRVALAWRVFAVDEGARDRDRP